MSKEGKSPIVHAELFPELEMTPERRKKLDDLLEEFKQRPENRIQPKTEPTG